LALGLAAAEDAQARSSGAAADEEPRSAAEGAVARLMKDPDAEGLRRYLDGVPVGVQTAVLIETLEALGAAPLRPSRRSVMTHVHL
jgi:hypothetical protein